MKIFSGGDFYFIRSWQHLCIKPQQAESFSAEMCQITLAVFEIWFSPKVKSP